MTFTNVVGVVVNSIKPGAPQVIDGVRHLPASCWCAKHIVLVPVSVIRRARTYACGKDCG